MITSQKSRKYKLEFWNFLSFLRWKEIWWKLEFKSWFQKSFWIIKSILRKRSYALLKIRYPQHGRGLTGFSGKAHSTEFEYIRSCSQAKPDKIWKTLQIPFRNLPDIVLNVLQFGNLNLSFALSMLHRLKNAFEKYLNERTTKLFHKVYIWHLWSWKWVLTRFIRQNSIVFENSRSIWLSHPVHIESLLNEARKL